MNTQCGTDWEPSENFTIFSETTKTTKITKTIALAFLLSAKNYGCSDRDLTKKYFKTCE